MKKFIKIYLAVFLYFALNISIHAASNTDLLTKIENDIYGYEYNNDSAQNRITRLEKTIYGKSSSGDINKRIQRLSGDISADVIGLEIEPVRDTFLAEEQAQEDSSVDYPVVNDIEEKIFNKTYKDRDLHSRIVAIEKKLFGKIYDVDDYSTRMDRIKAKVMPDTVNNDRFAKEYHDYNEMDYYDIQPKKILNGFNMPFGQKNYMRPYANYGDNFASRTGNENLNENLSQMEYDTFGTEFPNDDTNTRIKRLNSVNKAKKSKFRYDSQKFSQHMSTAMEIGAMILMILAMVL